MTISFKDIVINNETTVIHCDTEEKANNLVKWVYSLGKQQYWKNGISYLVDNRYYFGDKTCYCFKRNDICSIETALFHKIDVLKYEDVLITSDTSEIKEFTIHFSWHYDHSNDIKTSQLTVDANTISEAHNKVKQKYPNVKIK